MPEGHTIHLFASEHRRVFAKGVVRVSSPQGRFLAGAKMVSGLVLRDVRAHGKNLFYEFDRGRIVHVHLGLHGQFTLQRLRKGDALPEPRGAVRMRMVDEKAVLDLNGPIVCEVIDAEGERGIVERLGPDVLDPKAEPERAWERICKSGVSIALLLMDQTVMCGIGNAYRCEILYRQKLHPLRLGKSLSREQFDRLWADAVHLLKMGVRRKRAWAVDETDLQSPLRSDGEMDRYNVYRREKCRGCGARVKELALGGRRCFYCAREQRKRGKPE